MRNDQSANGAADTASVRRSVALAHVRSDERKEPRRAHHHANASRRRSASCSLCARSLFACMRYDHSWERALCVTAIFEATTFSRPRSSAVAGLLVLLLVFYCFWRRAWLHSPVAAPIARAESRVLRVPRFRRHASLDTPAQHCTKRRGESRTTRMRPHMRWRQRTSSLLPMACPRRSMAPSP